MRIRVVSLSARRAWIEMSGHRQAHTSPTSLSARRAWIEIRLFVWIAKRALVALRKESVDRNIIYLLTASGFLIVALRKESVDRNKYVVQCRKTLGVALRKESVDRNL